jgi:hypothetical protein
VKRPATPVRQVARNAAGSGTTLLLTEMCQQPLRAIARAHKLELFGRRNLAETLDIALERAQEIAATATT